MPRDEGAAPGVTAGEIGVLKKVAAELGPDGLRTFGVLLNAGVPASDAERILNLNQFADGFRTKDELQAFHDSLAAKTAAPEFHHLVLFLVEMGHTITEALTEVRDRRAFVLRLLSHNIYRRTFQQVRLWRDVDRLSAAEQKRERERYAKHGPDGELAALINERITARESREARAAMDARDAALKAKHSAPLKGNVEVRD